MTWQRSVVVGHATRTRGNAGRWAGVWLQTVSVVGSLLALVNVLVIAFGIFHLTRSPDLEVAGWVLGLTWLLSRRIGDEPTEMIPTARTL